MYKRGSYYYNGRGERIHNPCAYMKAILEDRYGLNNDPCTEIPSEAFEECGFDYEMECGYEPGDDTKDCSCDCDCDY